MALTVTQWIEKFSAYPSETLVRFIGNAVVFEDPQTGKDAKPIK